MKSKATSKRLGRPSSRRDILLACLSGILMGVTFLNFHLWLLAWVALVPLLLAIKGKGYRTSFWLSYLAGIVFFAVVLHWLCSLVFWVGGVVLLGLLLLVFYLAVYWGLFGLLVSFAREKLGVPVWISGAALWVVLEYVESKLFTGFGWALIGHTQAYNQKMIQWSSVGGVFIVSAIIVFANLMIYSAIVERRRRVLRIVGALATFAFIPLGETFVRPNQTGKSLRVAVVQGNFWQDVMWSPEYSGDSLAVYESLSDEAVRRGAELIVWPESAIPGFLEMDAPVESGVKQYAQRNAVPLLLGAKRAVRAEQTDDWQLYNSAYFISDQGQIADRYDKMHLAPFGEYVPLRNLFPFLNMIVPPMADFSPGDRRTIFNLNGTRFGVLICFETVFPDLARALARDDTDFLITITNVAWYGRSAAAFQDLAMCIFRAVENRMWLVRAANSGISCFIDPSGALNSIVEEEREIVFVRGWSVQNINAGKGFSLYRQIGDVFVLISGVWLAVVIAVGWRRRRSSA